MSGKASSLGLTSKCSRLATKHTLVFPDHSCTPLSLYQLSPYSVTSTGVKESLFVIKEGMDIFYVEKHCASRSESAARLGVPLRGLSIHHRVKGRSR